MEGKLDEIGELIGGIGLQGRRDSDREEDHDIGFT